MVWDYSLENIKVLKAHNVRNTYHIPLGYDKTMENTQPAAPSRDIDVLFVGSMNKRRWTKLAQLASVLQPGSRPLRVSTPHAWGAALSRLLQRSKLGLNLHYYGGRTILEVHRIIPLVISRVLVLTEPSDDKHLDTTFGGIVNFTTGDDIKQSVLEMLALEHGNEAERRYQQLLSCCRYADHFKAAFSQPFPAVWFIGKNG